MHTKKSRQSSLTLNKKQVENTVTQYLRKKSRQTSEISQQTKKDSSMKGEINK